MSRKRNGARRSSRRGGRRSPPTSLGGGVTPVAFHSFTSNTLSGVTGNLTYSVNPQSAPFAGVNEVADQFDLFKVVRLEYRLHPMDPTLTTNQVVAFYPDVDIQTQTVAQASYSPIAAVISPFCGVPSSWVKVPPSQLKGMLDWYKCSADAGAAEFESQGLLQAAGGLGDTFILEVRGLFHFKNPVSSALMFQRVIERAVASGVVVRATELAGASPPKLTTFPTPTGDRIGARVKERG